MEGRNLKRLLLLPALMISTLLIGILPVGAARKFNLYLPSQDFCAVYQGNIDNERTFTLWVDNNRQLTIKANRELKIAVTSGGNFIPAYQVGTLSEPDISQRSYRTRMTGNHLISIRGIAQDVTITFCLK